MLNKYSNKIYKVSELEENIIIGSLLGDGTLSLYGRSKNSYYREHGCIEQLGYRLWKYEKLKNLDFKINTNYKYPKISSHSNIYFTDLYNKFYINKIKTITEENIKLLTNPIGLACFYMDDGTLVIDSTKRKDNSFYIFPRITLYTLSFSEKENIIIQNHLYNTFNIQTNIKYRKDGKNVVLEINKKNEIIKFINIVKPYISEISCMLYKIDLEKRFNDKIIEFNKNGYKVSNTFSSSTINKSYTENEINFIIKSKDNGLTAKEISTFLNKPYYGILDKIRRLKINKEPEN